MTKEEQIQLLQEALTQLGDVEYRAKYSIQLGKVFESLLKLGNELVLEKEAKTDENK